MAATIIKKIVKKISDAARKKDTADRIKRFEHAGPHEGEVITKKILGKPTKKGDRTKAAVKDAMKVKEIGKEYGGIPHATGGRIGKKHGFQVLGGGVEGKPHSTREGRNAAGRRRFGRMVNDPKFLDTKPKWGGRKRPKKAEGGRIGLKKGGSDKKWIQKAVNPKHKGYCTPMTKKTCTPARKALARTFKKKAKTGWG